MAALLPGPATGMMSRSKHDQLSACSVLVSRCLLKTYTLLERPCLRKRLRKQVFCTLSADSPLAHGRKCQKVTRRLQSSTAQFTSSSVWSVNLIVQIDSLYHPLDRRAATFDIFGSCGILTSLPTFCTCATASPSSTLMAPSSFRSFFLLM